MMSSSRTEKGRGRRSSRATDWTDWIFDQPNQQYYRTRINENGEQILEWNTQSTSTVSQEIPRTDQTAATLSEYTSSTTSSDYGSNYAYGSTQTVENLANRLSGSSIDAEGSQGAYRSDPPEVAYSSTPSFQADSIPQIIPSRSILPSTVTYQCTTYSASAPSRSDTGSWLAVATTPGYYTTGHPAGLTYNTQNQQTYDPYARPAVSSPSYGIGTDVAAPTLQRETSGSGALTPKASNLGPNLIEAAAGAKKGDHETLDPRFKVHSSKHFKVFQVFKVLWSEPTGENVQSNASEVTKFTVRETKFGEKVHSSIRRFVVVMAYEGHCWCLPILTYQHQATKKRGVKRGDHAIIYTGNRPPKKLDGEDKLGKDPIEVVPRTPRDQLDFDSRINYAKVYTVEHNVKVHFVGRIAQKSERRFLSDFDATWQSRRDNTMISEE